MSGFPGHRLVVGTTGSGKTVYARHRALEHRGPVIVLDPQDDADAWPYPRADYRNTWSQIWRAARAGGVVYVPSANDYIARLEADMLLQRLFDYYKDDAPVLVVADEAHAFAPEGGRPSLLWQIARRGRTWGIWLLAVSQSPADLTKKVVKQCARHVVFALTDFETPYFERYHLPIETIRARLAQGGQYSYVEWDGQDLRGPFREPYP